ncbi:MAG TPA: cytochrome c3 family protein [Phycisphaerae bacterium]|nr:cytochrome c3 family protein [Phycisphaerae bacterium]
MQGSRPFVFPRWTNSLRTLIAAVVIVGVLYAALVVAYGASPQTTDVGYQPEQPVTYSHAKHAGELGIDCRYCHTTVEQAAHAAIPPTQTCMNCHTNITIGNSEKLTPVRESNASGMPIEWVRVHDLPDYVYFNHSAHVRRGVGCASCHGRVDKMELVHQVEPLSMGWCLDCHRRPERHLRPVKEVFNMGYTTANQLVDGRRLKELYNINPSTDCSTCHR